MLQTLLLVGMLELPSISAAGGVVDWLEDATTGEATGSAEAAGDAGEDDAGEDDAADDDTADDVAAASSCIAPDELELVAEHPATPTATSANPTTRVFNRPFTVYSNWVVVGMRFTPRSYTSGTVLSNGSAKHERFNRSLLYGNGRLYNVPPAR